MSHWEIQRLKKAVSAPHLKLCRNEKLPPGKSAEGGQRGPEALTYFSMSLEPGSLCGITLTETGVDHWGSPPASLTGILNFLGMALFRPLHVFRSTTLDLSMPPHLRWETNTIWILEHLQDHNINSREAKLVCSCEEIPLLYPNSRYLLAVDIDLQKICPKHPTIYTSNSV